MVNDNKGIVSETTSSSFNSRVIVFHRLDLYSYRGLGDTIKFKIKDYSIRNNKKNIEKNEKFKKKFKELKIIPNSIKDSMKPRCEITRSRVRWKKEGELGKINYVLL